MIVKDISPTTEKDVTVFAPMVVAPALITWTLKEVRAEGSDVQWTVTCVTLHLFRVLNLAKSVK
ncbi:MAG: hypothetical protein QGH39_02250, partial [Candidatus Thermoplasmatota archaeon]|nr:hypothetical protein [Candidatus Thermoplasmatota archaeon]